MPTDEKLQASFNLAFRLTDIDLGDMASAVQSFQQFPKAWEDDPTRLTDVIDAALALPPETRHNHPVWSFCRRIMVISDREPIPVGVLAASHHILRSDALPAGKKPGGYGVSSREILHIAFQNVLASWTDTATPDEVDYIKETLTAAPSEAVKGDYVVPPACAMPFLASPDYINYTALAPILSACDTDPERLRHHIAACDDTELHRITENPAAPAELLRDAFRRAEAAQIGHALTAFWKTGDPQIVNSLAHSSTFRHTLNQVNYYHWRDYVHPLRQESNADALRTLFLGGAIPYGGLPEASIAAIHNPGISDDECVALIKNAAAHAKGTNNYEVHTPTWSHNVLTSVRTAKRGTDLIMFVTSTLPWHSDMEDAFRSLIRDPNLTVEQLTQVANVRRKSAKNAVLTEIKRRGAQATAINEPAPHRPRVEVAAPSFSSARDAIMWAGSEYGYTAEGAVKGIQAALTNMGTAVKVRQGIAEIFATTLNAHPDLISHVEPTTWKLLFRFKSSLSLERDTLLAMMQCGDAEAERYAGKKIAESLT